jgi:hypothetical protein
MFIIAAHVFLVLLFLTRVFAVSLGASPKTAGASDHAQGAK